jgi:hypothetical protein
MENNTHLNFDAASTYAMNNTSDQLEGHGGGFGTANVGIHYPCSGSTETTYDSGLTTYIMKITAKPAATVTKRGPSYSVCCDGRLSYEHK